MDLPTVYKFINRMSRRKDYGVVGAVKHTVNVLHIFVLHIFIQNGKAWLFFAAN